MKTMKKMMTLLAVAGLVLALSPAAQATTITDDVEYLADYTITHSGWTEFEPAAWRGLSPVAGDFFITGYSTPPVNTAASGTFTFTAGFGAGNLIQAGTYAFTISVGDTDWSNRASFEYFNHRLQTTVGATELPNPVVTKPFVELTNNDVIAEWTTTIITYTVPAGHELIGEEFTWAASFGHGVITEDYAAAGFDAVSIEFNPPGGTTTTAGGTTTTAAATTTTVGGTTTTAAATTTTVAATTTTTTTAAEAQASTITDDVENLTDYTISTSAWFDFEHGQPWRGLSPVAGTTIMVGYSTSANAAASGTFTFTAGFGAGNLIQAGTYAFTISVGDTDWLDRAAFEYFDHRLQTTVGATELPNPVVTTPYVALLNDDVDPAPPTPPVPSTQWKGETYAEWTTTTITYTVPAGHGLIGEEFTWAASFGHGAIPETFGAAAFDAVSIEFNPPPPPAGTVLIIE
jgi:hypothetical protein